MELTYIAEHAGRLSSLLREEMKMSAGLVNRLKWNEKILVNGNPEFTDHWVQPGDRITVLMDPPEPAYPAQTGELSVLYEDAYILAVDKPSGMLIHPSRACNSGTLANYVAGYYERTGQQAAFHPLTRLDRDTFGVVLLAKNPHISHLLQAGQTKKTYHAITFGGPQNAQGEICAPIARKPLPSLLREIREDGKPSVTVYHVLERGNDMCKLALNPITGRTHQLRLHCAYMGFPILGDPQYATPQSAAFSQSLGLQTQQLCAKTLGLMHPVTGELLRIDSKQDVQMDVNVK